MHSDTLHDRVCESSTTGWKAKYEIRSNTGESLRAVWISLPDEEIRLLNRQSLRFDSTKGSLALNVKFPVAIADDLRSFSILRTVYTTNASTRTVIKADIQSAMIPLHLIGHFDAFWTLKSKFCESYSYSMSFSQTGHRLFFAGGPVFRNAVAIFEIDRKKGLIIKLLGKTEIARSRHLDIGEIDFHMSEPFVIFADCDRVLIWSYTDGELKLIANSELKDRFSNQTQQMMLSSKYFMLACSKSTVSNSQAADLLLSLRCQILAHPPWCQFHYDFSSRKGLQTPLFPCSR